MATQLENYENKYANIKKSIDSAGAYSSNRLPSQGELTRNVQLASVNSQIEDLKSEQLKKTWYGKDDEKAETETKPDGWFMGGLKALQRPLNAIMGAGQYAIGKGTESSLGSNIKEAMKTGLTAGNVLQQMGAPRGVQVPLGFALDVMLDPVNWLTVGTAALVPRVGVGLAKGAAKTGTKSGIMAGLEAAGKGVTSSVLKDTVSVMKLPRAIPVLGKLGRVTRAAELEGIKDASKRGLLAKGAMKYDDVLNKIGTKAAKASDEYDSLIGSNIATRINKTPLGLKTGVISTKIENLINKIPETRFTPEGEKIVKFFKYSPSDSMQMARYHDEVAKAAENKNIILVNSNNGVDFIDIADLEKPGASIIVKKEVKKISDKAFKDADGALSKSKFRDAKGNSVKAEDVLTGEKGELYTEVKTVVDGKKLMDLPRPVTVEKNFQNSKYFLESYLDDSALKKFEKTFEKTERGKTGFKWYDEKIEKLKDLKLGDIVPGTTKTLKEITDEAGELVKTVNSYDNAALNLKPLDKLLTIFPKYISGFKSAKVPMNPSSHVVAVIGNFFMGAMTGIPVQKLEYLNEVMKARKLLSGKLGAKGFYDIFGKDLNDVWDLMENNPNVFRKVTGMDAVALKQRLAIENKLLGTTKKEVARVLEQEIAGIERNLSKQTEGIRKAIIPKYATGTETSRELAKKGSITAMEESTSFVGETSNDMMDMMGDRVAKRLAENPDNLVNQLANTIVNSMPRWYEQVDQSYKIGTTNFLVKTGLTEAELIKISTTIPIEMKDITNLKNLKIVDGAKMYKLSPLKASEIAMEAYMDYSTMPDFVRMMRAVPFGSPFLSFPYAMAIKTAKTAVKNPSAFNKIGFMINEMNAARTPQEKEAMEIKYNEYLKSDTVVKMFGKWNTNVQNLVPFYQMNMLNPSERSYGNSTAGKMFGMFDKIPIFGDPITGTIKDYWIQPWVLSGSGETPQGQFGQPLYPAYDKDGNLTKNNFLKKVLYGTRNVAESLVPGVASFAGLPLGGVMSPESIEYLPSYGARNIAQATKGRSTIGAKTKEDAVRKTLRALLGRTGLPAYTLDASRITTKKK